MKPLFEQLNVVQALKTGVVSRRLRRVRFDRRIAVPSPDISLYLCLVESFLCLSVVAILVTEVERTLSGPGTVS